MIKSNCDSHNPWPGLLSYTENDSPYFFGREKDTLNIVERISNEMLTIVFGESGSGKTSLLQAGVFPLLHANNFFPVSIRFDFTVNDWSLALLKHELSIQAKCKECVIDESRILPISEISNESLWEYLHRIEIWDKHYNLLAPVVVIDQFEELFTNENKALQNDWIDQLVYAVNNYKPPYLKDISDDSIWIKIINKNKINYKFLFVIREDYVGKLDELKQRIPSVMTNRVLLKKLSVEQARTIINKPGNGIFNELASDDLVKFLTGPNPSDDYIDPSILSLTCRELNKRRIEKNDSEIDKSYIERFGKDILSDFYQECLLAVTSAAGEFIENSLLTSSGNRNLVSYDDINFTRVTPKDIGLLVNKRLLHIEERHGQKWIELSHDILTAVVKENRINRQLKLEKKRIRTAQRNALAASGRMEHDNSYVISDEDIDIADSSTRMLQHKLNNWAKFKKGESLSDLLRDFPTSNIIELSFKDISEKQCSSKDEIYSIRIEYDINNLITQVSYYDSIGKRMLHKRGNHGFRFEYDKNGNEIKRIIIGINGSPKCLKDGYAIIKTAYDNEDNPCRVTYFNRDDIPCNHRERNHGYISSFDRRGNEIQRDFIDINGEKILLKEGYSSIKQKYNNDGLIISQRNYIFDDIACCDVFGNHGIEFEYDDKGRVVKQIYIGIDEKRANCADGYPILQIEYNNNDQPITQRFYDIDNKPAYDILGNYGLVFEYDKKERISSLTNIDIEGKRTVSKFGYSLTRLDYDEKGRASSFLHYGINDNPTCNNADGVKAHGYKFEFDELGRTTKLTYVSPSGNPIKNRDGVAIITLKYEDFGRIKERLFYDENNEPIISGGIYGEIYEFFDYSKAHLYYCDKNGEKILNEVYEIELNDAEKIRRFTYLDANKNVIISNELGYASEKREYDIYGNVIRVEYVDENDIPIADHNGDYGFEDIKNIDGFTAEERLLGANGKPHKGKDGYAIIKFEYDTDGNITKKLFFDENGNPVTNADGNHGEIKKYDRNGNTTYSELLGIDGMPHNGKDGHAIIRYIYDKGYKRSYFDNEDKPTCCLDGYHCYELTSNNNVTVTNFFDTNSQLTNTKNNYSTIRKTTKNKYYGGYYGGYQIYLTYENSLGEKVNNENGYYKIISDKEIIFEDGYYKINKDQIIKAFDKDNTKIIDNRKITQDSAGLFMYFIFTILIFIALPFYFISELKKYIFNLVKKETILTSIVIVGDVDETFMAKSLGVEKMDFIIDYNEWSLFANNQTDVVSEFENEFYKVGRNQKTIRFGRKVKNKYIFFKLDFPFGVMGIHIEDRNIPQKQFEEIKECYFSEYSSTCIPSPEKPTGN